MNTKNYFQTIIHQIPYPHYLQSDINNNYISRSTPPSFICYMLYSFSNYHIITLFLVLFVVNCIQQLAVLYVLMYSV